MSAVADLKLSFEEFKNIMEDYDVIPMFVNPHKSAQHKQAPAFRNMTPAEREVLLLLGSEIQAQAGQILIHENERVSMACFVVLYAASLWLPNGQICTCSLKPLHIRPPLLYPLIFLVLILR
jgi:hypothetical protein